MFYKEVLSAIAIGLTVIAHLPYILSIFRGKTRPHVFSWVIWSATTFVVFLAQLEGGAGVGAWPIGVSGVITFIVAVLAYIKRSDISVTKTDWLFFIMALSSLPFWYFTADPLWAVVILTIVDILGFGPTVRKTYSQPYSESLLFYGIFGVRNIIVIAALEAYSLTTVLFPAAVAVACVSLMLMMLYRRRII